MLIKTMLLFTILLFECRAVRAYARRFRVQEDVITFGAGYFIR